MAKSRNRTIFLHLAALLVVASWSSTSRLTHQPYVAVAEAAATNNTSSKEKIGTPGASSESYDTSSPSVAQDEPPSAEAPAKESPSNQENPTLLPEASRMTVQEGETLLQNSNIQPSPKDYAAIARGTKKRRKQAIMAGVFGTIGGIILGLAMNKAAKLANLRF